METQDYFYSQELNKSFDTIEEMKQEVSDFYEKGGEFKSRRSVKRKGNSGKKKDGTKKYFFKKTKPNE